MCMTTDAKHVDQFIKATRAQTTIQTRRMYFPLGKILMSNV